MNLEELAKTIERRIADVAELDVIVQVDGNMLVLDGIVDSESNREAASDIATSLAGDIPISNDIQLQDTEVDGASELEQLPAQMGPVSEDSPLVFRETLNPDFTDQPLNSDVEDVVQNSQDDTFYAPTDSLLPPTPGDPFVGDEDNRSSDGRLGDEALAEAVVDRLRWDSATSALTISVTVRERMARLRGSVEDISDSDNVEAVAQEVSGIVGVINELTVTNQP